jgi:hypothetical protein
LPRIDPINVFNKTELIFYGKVPKVFDEPFDISSLSMFSKFNVKKIVFGTNHCLIQFKNRNEVGGFGSNDFGQLGFEIKSKENESNYYQQIVLNNLELEKTTNFEVVDIIADNNESFILVKFEKSETFGKCNYIYKLGLDEKAKFDNHNNIKYISRVSFKYDTESTIKSIYSRNNRKFALTDNNSVFLKGINFNLENHEKFKKIINNFEKDIMYLSVEDNKCYAFTSNIKLT